MDINTNFLISGTDGELFQGKFIVRNAEEFNKAIEIIKMSFDVWEQNKRKDPEPQPQDNPCSSTVPAV